MHEIYESFVISLALAGKVFISDFWVEKKEVYLSHSWIQAPKRWGIGAPKEANANRTALNTGSKTGGYGSRKRKRLEGKIVRNCRNYGIWHEKGIEYGRCDLWTINQTDTNEQGKPPMFSVFQG